MIYLISDLHFGHSNIIKFCNRQFDDIQSMNKHIIDSWNKVVTNDDEIYMLGDFSFKTSERSAKHILKQLNGKKYFLKGNHDRTSYLNNFKNSGLIEWWDYSYYLKYEHDGKIYNFSLSHYPNYPVKGSDIICLHGHVHGKYEHHGGYFHHPGVLDVGVDNIGYEPISILKIIENL